VGVYQEWLVLLVNVHSYGSFLLVRSGKNSILRVWVQGYQPS
jgi:hypothetical protein